MRTTSVCFFALVAFALASPPIAGGGLGGFALGDSLADAGPRAARRCSAYRIDTVEPPSFPLARDREAHLVCRGLETSRGIVRKAVFVFADGVLVAMEARGGAASALGGGAGEEAESYLRYRIFDDGERFVDPTADVVWILNEGAQHLNLFTWSNPHLSKTDGATPRYRQAAEIPPVLDFEEPLDSQLRRFEEDCPLLEVSRDERVWLPTQPGRQAQVNCFGFEYAGFPRKFEAVYGDGRLQVVWILTGKGEEDRLRRALEAAFGEPMAVNKDWEVFSGGLVALRKDKPEILLMSEAVAPHYRKDIGLE